MSPIEDRTHTGASNGTPWAGPHLLVPMALDVLLMDETNREGISHTRYNYDRLDADQEILPPGLKFKPHKDVETGAYLNWYLPRGLRTGRHRAAPPGRDDLRQGNAMQGKELEFALVPNRWLVVRFAYPVENAGGQKPDITYWMIESDAFSGTSSFVQPQPGEDGRIIATAIGKVSKPFTPAEPDGWQETAAGKPQFLTAQAPGNPAFSVGFDTCRDVFAMLDTSVCGLGDRNLTYGVIGWYAHSKSDPLFGAAIDPEQGWETFEQWLELIDALRFNVESPTMGKSAWNHWLQARPQAADVLATASLRDNHKKVPAQMLLHGMTHTVKWRGETGAHGHNRPRIKPVLAAGPTAAEATAAWLAKYLKQDVSIAAGISRAAIEKQLLALHYGLGDELDSLDPDQLEERLHRERFSTLPGGHTWIVRLRIRERPATPDGSGTADGPENPAPGKAIGRMLADTQGATPLLVKLNQHQARMDRAQQECAVLRWELASTLRKKMEDDVPGLQARQETLIEEITRLNQEIQRRQEKIRQHARDLQNKIGQHYVLQLNPREPFTLAAEPSLLFTGYKVQQRQTTDEVLLPARFTGQTLSGLRLKPAPGATGETRLSGADILDRTGIGALPFASAVVPDLLAEFILLDPLADTFLAGALIEKAGPGSGLDRKTLAGHLGKERAGFLVRQEQLQAAAPTGADRGPRLSIGGLFDGGLAPYALSFGKHVQPWLPIYVDWSIKWVPSGFDPGTDDPAKAFPHWQWRRVDHGLASMPPESELERFYEFRGRSLFEKQVKNVFMEKIRYAFDRFADQLDEASRQQLQKVLAKLSAMDVLTQGTGNLYDFLLMRYPEVVRLTSHLPTREENDRMRELIGTVPGLIPATSNDQLERFMPFSGGFFLIGTLRIIDAFGQTVEVFDYEAPIIADSVSTHRDAFTGHIALPPRFSQPLRPQLTLLQARRDEIGEGDPPIPSNDSDATSPIDGWVMLNHLDRSLMIFSDQGEHLGALAIVLDDALKELVRWEPAPGRAQPPGARPRFPGYPRRHRFLQHFVNGILKHEMAGRQALAPLIATLDSFRCNADGGGPPPEDLGTAIGHPFALVRASARVEAMGGPRYHQAPGQSVAKVTRDYLKTPLSLRLENITAAEGGTAGFFLNDDYSRFHATLNSGDPAPTMPLLSALGQDPHAPESALRSLQERLGRDDGEGAFDSGGYIVPDPGFTVRAGDEAPQLLTLLVDPAGPIDLVSGLCPCLSRRLPQGPVDQGLKEMSVTFRMGPVLTAPESLRMPAPEELTGRWTWMERVGVTFWQEKTEIERSTPQARLTDKPSRMKEGWLKLSNGHKKRDDK